MTRVGPFRWHPSTDEWSWSPAMFEILGYHPDAVVPTRSLTMAHVHPDDRARVGEIMAAAVQHLDAFVSAHRVVTVTDAVREVLVLGYAQRRRSTDVQGRPDTVLRGWVVDRTAIPETRRPDDDNDDNVDPTVRRATEIAARTLDTDLDTARALIAHLATDSSPAAAIADRVISTHLDPDEPGLASLLQALEPRPGL